MDITRECVSQLTICSVIEAVKRSTVSVSSYQPFVAFLDLCYPHADCYCMNFYYLIKLLSSSHLFLFSHLFTLSTHHLYMPALRAQQHNSHSRLIERMQSAPIHFSKQQKPSYHSDSEERAWVFLLEHS